MYLAGKLLCAVVLAGVLSGCTTTQGGNASLQARVTQLERSVSQQEQTIDELRQRGSMTSSRSSRPSSSASSSTASDNRGIIRVPVAPREVQTALQNAGYYSGNIDGKIGGKTIEAIKKFQRDNNLKVDGIVGASTWAQMKSAPAAAPVAAPAAAVTDAAE